MTEAKHPEIDDVDLTLSLLQVAEKTAGDRTLSATHASAYEQLGSLNAKLQEQIDKNNKAAADAAAKKEADDAAAAKKAAEDAEAAAKKEADAAAKKAEQDAAKTNKTHA